MFVHTYDDATQTADSVLRSGLLVLRATGPGLLARLLQEKEAAQMREADLMRQVEVSSRSTTVSY